MLRGQPPRSSLRGRPPAVFVLRGLSSPLCARAVHARGTDTRWGCMPRTDVGALAVAPGARAAARDHRASLWNGGVENFFDEFVLFCLVLQVPLFGVLVIAVVLVSPPSGGSLPGRLSEYRLSGWYTTAEVAMLATGAGRRQAKAWAAPNPRSRQMKQFSSFASGRGAPKDRHGPSHQRRACPGACAAAPRAPPAGANAGPQLLPRMSRIQIPDNDAQREGPGRTMPARPGPSLRWRNLLVEELPDTRERGDDTVDQWHPDE